MAQDIVNSLQTISYTSKDFNAIYPELLDTVKKLSYKWDPSISNESDPGVILLKLNAIIADKCNYNIDTSVLECFPLSVTQQRNAHQLFEQLGYYMKWKQSAITNVTLKWIGTITTEDAALTYTVPAFTEVTDADSTLAYTLIGPAETDDDNSFIVADQLISTTGSTTVFKAIQGSAVAYDVNGETCITINMLDSNNRLYFPTLFVAQNGIFIRNIDEANYSAWQQKENLLLETVASNNRFFKFGLSQDLSTCYIEFPENASELIKDGINITYIRTDGNTGNITAQFLSQFSSTLVPAEDSTVKLTADNVKIYNITAGIGGSEYESIEDAYDGYKKTIGTFNTLITLRDYLNKILNSDLASNGFVCDRTNDIQSTYKVMTYDNGVSYNFTYIEDTDADDEHYSLLTTEPNDWAMNYATYFTRTKINSITTYTPNTSSVWSSNTFYERLTDKILNAFSIKLYLLNYINNISLKSDFESTFEPQSDTSLAAVEAYIDDVKCIAHDFESTISTTDDSMHFCYFENIYPLNISITTQYTLTDDQKKEVKTNIINNLYTGLNASKLDFGEVISIDYISKLVSEADGRIQNVSIDSIDLKTYAIYKNASGTYEKVYINEPIQTPFKIYRLNGTTEEIVTDEIEIDEATYMEYINFDYSTHRFTREQNTEVAQEGTEAPSDWEQAFYTYFTKVDGVNVYCSSSTTYTSNTYYDYTGRLLTAEQAPDDWGKRDAIISEKYYAYVDGKFILVSWKAPTYPTVTVYKSVPVFSFDSVPLTDDPAKLGINNSLAMTPTSTLYIKAKPDIQARDEIYTKSVLAGQTQFFVKDETFDYTIAQNYTSITNSILNLKTDLKIELTAHIPEYELRSNESIQLMAPNFIDSTVYSNAVKMEWQINKDISANCNYQLSDNEFIAFYWKEDLDENTLYSYYIYEKGNIICPSFKISASGNSLNKYYEAIWRDKESQIQGTGTSSNPRWISSDICGNMLEDQSKSIATIVASGNILSGTKTVAIKRVSEVVLDEKIQCYWITDKLSADSKKYVLDWTSGNGTYQLKNNEYFIYTNSAHAEMIILGTGTTLQLNTELSISDWMVTKISIDTILETGISELENVWYSIAPGYTINATENTFISIGSGNKIKLEPNNYTYATCSGAYKKESVTQESVIVTIDSSTFKSSEKFTYSPLDRYTFECTALGSSGLTDSTWRFMGNELQGAGFADYGISVSIPSEISIAVGDTIEVTSTVYWRAETNSTETKIYGSESSFTIDCGTIEASTFKNGVINLGIYYPTKNYTLATSDLTTWTIDGITISSLSDYGITITSTLVAPVSKTISYGAEPSAQQSGLADFNIYYKTSTATSWTQVPSVSITQSTSRAWNMNSLLSLSSTIGGQPLLSAQSITYNTNNVIEGQNENIVSEATTTTSSSISISDAGTATVAFSNYSSFKSYLGDNYIGGANYTLTVTNTTGPVWSVAGPQFTDTIDDSSTTKNLSTIGISLTGGTLAVGSKISITAELITKISQSNYPVVVDFSNSLSISGGNETYNFSSNVPKMYTYNRMNSQSVQWDLGNYEIVYNNISTGSAVVRLLSGVLTGGATCPIKLDFKVPSGNYIIPITISDNTDMASITVKLSNETALPLMYSSTATCYTAGLTYYFNYIKTDNDAETLVIELDIQTETNSADLAIIVDNFYSYTKPDNLINFVYTGDLDSATWNYSTIIENRKSYYYNKIKYLISKFDKDHIFNYTYQVPTAEAIPNPLTALSFNNSNHIFNPFTIWKYDTSDIIEYSVSNKENLLIRIKG